MTATKSAPAIDLSSPHSLPRIISFSGTEPSLLFFFFFLFLPSLFLRFKTWSSPVWGPREEGFGSCWMHNSLSSKLGGRIITLSCVFCIFLFSYVVFLLRDSAFSCSTMHTLTQTQPNWVTTIRTATSQATSASSDSWLTKAPTSRRKLQNSTKLWGIRLRRCCSLLVFFVIHILDWSCEAERKYMTRLWFLYFILLYYFFFV